MRGKVMLGNCIGEQVVELQKDMRDEFLFTEHYQDYAACHNNFKVQIYLKLINIMLGVVC